MSRRILSLWLPCLATDVIERRRRDWSGRALVVVAAAGGRGVAVVAVNREAASSGLGPGMTLADARALVPDLVAVEADPGGMAATLDRLADWAGRYTPSLAVEESGLILDITGCAHLFGGEEGMIRDITARLGRAGFLAHAAIADTPGAARAAARWQGPEVIAPGGQRPVLAALPVAALGVAPATLAALARVGLRRIGDLYPIPRRALAARFGLDLGVRLDRALGIAAEPISPRRPAIPHLARLAFVDPIATAESIAAAVRRLLETVCAGLVRAGEGARRVDLSCFPVDAGCDRLPQVIAIGTSRAVRAPAALFSLLQQRLGDIAPGEGLEVLVLAASVTERFQAVPGGLGGGLGEGNGGGDEGDLGALIDRLGMRLGPIRRPVPRASWWPEHAVAWAPALEPFTGAAWPSDRPRPLRLLERPEPIEVMAPVPDDPPVMFRWRGVVHRVSQALGPERLEPEWWRGLTELRDYYRVEDGDGHRFWLFRVGRYQPDRPAPWFVHGFFG